MTAPRDVSAFRAFVAEANPPADLQPALLAMWHDARGAWETAHETVQPHEEGDPAWVHAYLHRKEGDLANAAYWYRRAGKPVASGSLDDEWDQIVGALLEE